MKDLKVRKTQCKIIQEVLFDNGYFIREEEGIYFITLKGFDDSIKLIMIVEDETLFLQLDIIKLKELKETIELYKALLDMNTEILPVSLAIDSTDKNNERLVINESLEIQNLDENELLKVLETIEMSIPKVYRLLKNYKK